MGNPLLALDNVVVSPGAAGRTPEALRRALRVAVENALLYQEAGAPLSPTKARGAARTCDRAYRVAARSPDSWATYRSACGSPRLK